MLLEIIAALFTITRREVTAVEIGVQALGDTLETRNRSGGATDSTNFRSDVNAAGFVNSGDTLLVRSHSGGSCPEALWFRGRRTRN